jgi:hypothetical protein
MSSSDPDSKIDVLDDVEVVKRKLKKAHAAPKVVEDNGVLSFVEYVLLPAGHLIYGEPKFVVERRAPAEPLTYTDIKKMQEDYANDILTPQDLKPAVTQALNALLEPVQKEFKANQAWQDIEQKAYPPPPVVKKEKKVKNKGTFHPKRNVEAKPDGHVEGEDKAKVDVGTEGGEKAIEGLTHLNPPWTMFTVYMRLVNNVGYCPQGNQPVSKLPSRVQLSLVGPPHIRYTTHLAMRSMFGRSLERSTLLQVQDQSKRRIAIKIISMQPFAPYETQSLVQFQASGVGHLRL